MTTTKVKIPVGVKEEISLSQLETWTSKNTSPKDYLETLRKDYTVDSTNKEIEDVITALGIVDPKQCLNDIEVCDTINNLAYLIPDYFPKQFDEFLRQFELLVCKTQSLVIEKELNDTEILASRYISTSLDKAVHLHEINLFRSELEEK